METERIYTAWELGADHEWIDEGYVALTLNGRAEWELVECPNSGDCKTVKLSRLETKGGLRYAFRYIDPETPMRLRKVT